MTLLNDANFWFAVLVVAGLVAGTAAVVLGALYIMRKILGWIAAAIRAVAPPAVANWIIGLVRFFYVAALFCGLTAFALDFVIWRAPWPPGGLGDPIFRNPLFWLTWLAVMAAIMMLGIIGGRMLLAVATIATARLSKGLQRVERSTE